MSSRWTQVGQLCAELQEKDVERKGSQSEWDDKIEELDKKVATTMSQLSTFEKLFKLLISVDGNGSTKPSDTTLLEFFEAKIGEAIGDAPAMFHSCEIAFEDVTVLLATHISALRKEEHQKQRLSTLLVKKTKRQQAHARAFQEQKRKADQICTEHGEGMVEAKRRRTEAWVMRDRVLCLDV